ncbi:hypothetical protein MRB53_011355 [Persea americana]|uniref:Uncharacterized protein n=1 Tax=Persea americana TaxID=3435 RepID=A0ACC2LUP5_PERAE|nr:hypothetical protein MRB53_011355 [Persea americana]
MNPGPFNVKEHALIAMFANSGLSSPTSAGFMTIMKVFYHRKFSLAIAMLLGKTSQLIGYGYAGLFMKFLVDSPKMWWPSVVAQVSLYRTLHVPDVRTKGKLTRFQFFIIVSVTSFAYYIVPNILFPSVTALSIVGWIWKDSVTAHQIGSAVLTHTVLYHGRSVWKQFKETYHSQQQEGDVHNRLMKSYRTVPQWWFYSILFLSSVVAILMCIFIPQLQLPVWGFLVALITSVTMTLSAGVFYATANQWLSSTDHTQELAMGYLLPGRPLAMETFRVYNSMSMSQALSLLGDFKLGHYMKIPPRLIFIVQVVGQIISDYVHVGVTWWLSSTTKNFCESDNLSKGVFGYVQHSVGLNRTIRIS